VPRVLEQHQRLRSRSRHEHGRRRLGRTARHRHELRPRHHGRQRLALHHVRRQRHVGREARPELLDLRGVRRPGAEQLTAEAQRVLDRVEALEHDEPGIAAGVGDVGEPHDGAALHPAACG